MITRRRQVLPFLLLTVGGCAGQQSALNPTGAQASTIGHLFHTFLWITIGIYVLVLLSILYVIARSRREDPRAVPPDVLPTRTSARRSTVTVASLVVITTIILFVLLIVDFSANRTLAGLRSQSDLQIKITGHQWWWEVTYQDPVASQQAVTANEIHIPTGTVIRFDLESNDVIHSFWVPNLHGKKDLIPGHPTSIYMRADQAGTYDGQCAEFCGVQHAHMRFVVIAEPREKFDAWLNAQRAGAPEPIYEDQKRGKQVFLGSTCIMCHAIGGTSAGGSVGPNLTHVASRLSLAAGTIPNNPGHLAGWILDPQRIKPGVRMPQHNLSPDDLKNLLAYLETLK